MSIHIAADKGEIADTVLMPGDPLRAQFIADQFLGDPICYNNVRGMLGFTGFYEGERISVQSSGMGIPSFLIYCNELFKEYGVKRIIRVGSCGAIQKEVGLKDIIIAQGACTNSAINKTPFKGMDFAPIATFSLLERSYHKAKELSIPIKIGNVLSNDAFYAYDEDHWKIWAEHGVLAVDMETAALYTLAVRFGREALSLLTVSGSHVSDTLITPEERERGFTEMIRLALAVI